MTAPPRVSVCVVTWSHERYLGDALDSILAQDFRDFEVVLGVDRCDDRTLDVARAYAARDARVRLLEPEPERLGGRGNFLRTFGAARGEYVAWCDGDDGWTNPGKLRAQVEQLDRERDLSGSFHGAYEVDADGRRLPRPHRAPGERARYGPEDLVARCIVFSCTFVYRRALLDPLPDWLALTPTADWPIAAHLAARGPLGYLPHEWAFHRVHSAGVWCGLDEDRRLAAIRRTQDLLVSHVLGPGYARIVETGRDRQLLHVARKRESRGDLPGALALLDDLRALEAPGRTIGTLRFWRRYARLRLRLRLRRALAPAAGAVNEP